MTTGSPEDLAGIGEVAARVGLDPDTIRYYERLGVLPPPARDAEFTGDRANALSYQITSRAIPLHTNSTTTRRRVRQVRDPGSRPCPTIS